MRSTGSITLGDASALQAEILPYGGILKRLSFPVRGARRELVLSLPTLEDYVRDGMFLGIIVGRVAGRIAGATFELDGRRYHLTANEGANHLHGGALGFGKRTWRVANQTLDQLALTYHSPAGEEGYPGNLDVEATYTVEATAIDLQLVATCDAPTPLNLTWHPYFAVRGDEHLRIPASNYLPVSDTALIPTGDIVSVAETPFDFRSPRGLEPGQHEQIALARGYDHCWILDRDADCVAELHWPGDELTMRILSNQPAVQFYGGQWLASEHPTLGRGICLEPQRFPPAALLPGATHITHIRCEFHASR